MPTFLIVSSEAKPDLAKKIKDTFGGEEFYTLGADQWLVEADETTQDVAEKLGVRQGDFGQAVVFRVDTWSGYHVTSLWEWLQLE